MGAYSWRSVLGATVVASQTPASWPADTQRLRLGAVLIDLRFRRIERADDSVVLPQRFFDLLMLLLREPERVHSRAELLDRVWAGVIVEDANLSQAVWSLRKALGAEHRQWIRTVAKSGYVFQPGVPIVPLAVDAPSVEPAPTISAAPLRTAPAASRRWVKASAVGLLLLVIAGWALQPTAELSPPNRIVSVVEVVEDGTPLATRWPATLLCAWLEWRLSMLPEVTLLQGDQLAADSGLDAPVLTLIVSAGAVANAGDLLYLQLRGDGGRQPATRIETSTAQMPAQIEALTERLLSQFAPESAATQGPPLSLAGELAPVYAAFLDAREGLRWSEAAMRGRDLVVKAPEFSLLRLQLAEVLSMLGQMNEARAHAVSAQALLGQLPDAASAVLAAQLASARRDPVMALPLYQSLVARFPQQRGFVLEQARALLALERGADALALIDAHDWLRQPAIRRTTALLLRAQAQLQLTDAAGARQSASAAMQLATAAQWPLEQGVAQMQLAAAERVERRAADSGEAFLQAVPYFEAAGDTLRAQQARLSALGAAGADPALVQIQLDELIAQARSAGNRGLEIAALRTAAFQQLRAGHPANYRLRLAQAAAVAEASGDGLVLSRMDLYLLPVDLERGEYASVDLRLQRLSGIPLQGESAFWLAHFAHTLAWRRGQFELLDTQLQPSLASAAGLPQQASVGPLRDYVRGQLRLRRGELEAARRAFEQCADSHAPVFQILAQLGHARLQLYAGDSAGAEQRLRELAPELANLSSLDDQLGLRLELAEIAARAGLNPFARAQLGGLLSVLEGNGQTLLQAEALLVLARIALAEGEWELAGEHAQQARSLAPDDDWQLTAPLQQLAALAHLDAGEVESAKVLLTDIAEQARARGDQVVLAAVYALMVDLDLQLPCCMPQERRALIGRTGLRGVRWQLPAPMPMPRGDLQTPLVLR